MIIAFMGPPGSGKGTIAQMFAQKGWVHFSMGEALREYARKNERFSAKVAKIQAEGKLVPNSITQHVLEHVLSKEKKSNMIWDGFPRNVGQISGAKRALKKMGHDFAAFVYFDLSHKEIIARLSARQDCEKCGRIYGLHVKPKIKGKCDVDKGKLIHRSDDKPSVIRERFRVYEKETLPILEWASKYYPVFSVNASGKPTAIFKRVEHVLSLVKK